MDFLYFLFDSTLNQVIIGIMILLLLETVAVSVWLERLRRRVKVAHTVLRQTTQRLAPHDERPRSLSADISRFLNRDVGRARWFLGILEEIGPFLGLACTTLAFMIALPGFWEDLQNDPDRFFQKIGMAMATTCIGALIKLVAFVQGARVDAEVALLNADLDLIGQPAGPWGTAA